MENETQTQVNNQQKISTSTAIVIAGFLIMIGIIFSNGGGIPAVAKTLSEEVGVSKEKLNACIKSMDLDTLSKNIDDSVNLAMSHIPRTDRGTPYSIVIGPNGFIADIRTGANSYTNLKKIVDAAKQGKIATEVISLPQKDGSTKEVTRNLSEIYTGKVVLPVEGEHTLGGKDAVINIVEYSDFECIYCKQFHPVLEKLINESNGTIKWTYRHNPLHQGSFEKLVASECIAKIKGNDAFWEYSDLLFGLLKTGNESVSEKL